jgi:hypothetical protein
MNDSSDTTPPKDSAETIDIVERLRLTASRIAQWQLDAKRLNAILAETPGPLEPLVMLDVEETAGAIYKEIDAFDALLIDVDRKSHAAAGQIAEVGDALRLVLLSITELSTAMYARESADVVSEP